MFWYFDLMAFIDSTLLPLLLWLFLLHIEIELRLLAREIEWKGFFKWNGSRSYKTVTYIQCRKWNLIKHSSVSSTEIIVVAFHHSKLHACQCDRRSIDAISCSETIIIATSKEAFASQCCCCCHNNQDCL